MRSRLYTSQLKIPTFSNAILGRVDNNECLREEETEEMKQNCAFMY